MAQEKNFENKIKKFLKEENCYFIKYWAGAAFTKAGIPDILCCCNGRFLGVEVKASDGRPSKLQLYNLKKIDEAGGFGILLYPEDFSIFQDLITGIKSNSFSGQALDYYKTLKGRWLNASITFKG